MGGEKNCALEDYYYGDVRGSVNFAAIYQVVGLSLPVDSL